MAEIYWITRLDALINMFITLLVIGICWIIVSIICKAADEDYSDGCNFRKMVWKYTPTWIVVIIISLAGVTLIPNKNDALLIYGVGGTIEYIQNNKTAIGIPDKMIKCIDRWFDEIDEEYSHENNSRRR